MKLIKDCTLIGIEGVEEKVPQFLRAADICQHYIKFTEVKLLSPYELNRPEHQKIKKLSSVADYCKFVIKELYKYIDTKYLILFQNDGWILNPDAWEDTFLNYDYIGAPWAWEKHSCGNGGFTLRTKALMEECSKIITDEYHPEDVIICVKYKSQLESKGFKFAPKNIAERFSLEQNHEYNEPWNGQFGFHDIKITDISGWRPPKLEGYKDE